MVHRLFPHSYHPHRWEITWQCPFDQRGAPTSPMKVMWINILWSLKTYEDGSNVVFHLSMMVLSKLDLQCCFSCVPPPPKKNTSSYYKSATSYGRVTTSRRSMSAIYESPFNVEFKFNYKMKKWKRCVLFGHHCNMWFLYVKNLECDRILVWRNLQSSI